MNVWIQRLLVVGLSGTHFQIYFFGFFLQIYVGKCLLIMRFSLLGVFFISWSFHTISVYEKVGILVKFLIELKHICKYHLVNLTSWSSLLLVSYQTVFRKVSLSFEWTVFRISVNDRCNASFRLQLSTKFVLFRSLSVFIPLSTSPVAVCTYGVP